MANWAWPEISDEDSARSAAHKAGVWAGIIAGITALIVVIKIFTSGQNEEAVGLLDAALFGVVGWRVWNGSRPWAIAGLALYLLEIVVAIVTHPPGISILTIFILLALINGVRGTFKLHEHVEARKQQEAMTQAAAAAVAATPQIPTFSAPPPPRPPSA
jgi:hypothetical protein